jgi:hypothetical protein
MVLALREHKRNPLSPAIAQFGYSLVTTLEELTCICASMHPCYPIKVYASLSETTSSLCVLLSGTRHWHRIEYVGTTPQISKFLVTFSLCDYPLGRDVSALNCVTTAKLTANHYSISQTPVCP